MTPLDARTLEVRTPRARRTARAAGAGLALVLLGAVFAAYLDPQLVFALANRAWACL